MSELIDVVQVQVIENYQLELMFENGEKKRFDMKPYLHKKPFNRLVEDNLFYSAHIDYGTVVWSGNIDISPEKLYDRSCRIDNP